MKLPFSLFGKKPKPEERAQEPQEHERAPFPVELAVAQVQAATGMRFGQQAAPQSELLEAAAVLSVLADPLAATGPKETQAIAAPQPSSDSVPVSVEAPAPSPQPLPAPVASLVPVPAPMAPLATPQATGIVAAEAVPPASPPVPPTSSPPSSPADVAADAGIGRDEVVAAYRLFLRRDPESEAVIEPRLGISREKLLSAFIVSPKFLQHAENINLVLEIAKSLELRQPASAPTPGVPVLTQADVDAAKRIFWPDPHDQAIQPLVGETADRTLSQLMRSEHFQKNEFNATLIKALAREIVERLNKK